jgi:uncharacterized protein YjbI with pentapeptide repeats
VGSAGECWAHLTGRARQEALAWRKPGGRLDARGTVLTSATLSELLSRMRPASGAVAHLDSADFTGARFENDVQFDDVHFSGQSSFSGAVFLGKASFYGTEFTNYVSFRGANFHAWANFERASFDHLAFKEIENLDYVTFEAATFAGLAEFFDVNFGAADFTSIVARGDTRFLGCRFRYGADFRSAKFVSTLTLGRSIFECTAEFADASFGGDAHFVDNEFAGDGMFVDTVFQGQADFGEAKFHADAWFQGALFEGKCFFAKAEFGGIFQCRNARFDADADLAEAKVAGDMYLESLNGCGSLNLYGLQVGKTVEITGKFSKIEATDVTMRGRTWFRLAGTQLWIENSQFDAPLTLESQIAPDTHKVKLSGAEGLLHLQSLSGTDADHLTLVDVDLSRCKLSGLRRPESLRLAGRCRFAPMPTGLCLRYGWLPWRWSAREGLFEEHLWRAASGAPAHSPGWQAPDPQQDLEVSPDRLAVTYRQIRAVLEAARNEPGAADFYYGEMEMRRAVSQLRAERWPLNLYWLVSGYGLRATRALMILAALILAAGLTLSWFGFSGAHPGVWPSILYASSAVLSLQLVNHTASQTLTEWGEVVRIILRLGGPVFLGLAALAVRGRLKR